MKSPAELKKMYKDLNTENIKLKQRIEIQAQMITKMDQAITKQAHSILIKDPKNWIGWTCLLDESLGQDVTMSFSNH